MAPSAQQLLKDALQLPDQQRAELLVELLDSLPSAESGQERSDAQWLSEIERRARAAQAGAAGVSWEEARTQVVCSIRSAGTGMFMRSSRYAGPIDNGRTEIQFLLDESTDRRPKWLHYESGKSATSGSGEEG